MGQTVVVVSVGVVLFVGFLILRHLAQVKWPTEAAIRKLNSLEPRFAIAKHEGSHKVMRHDTYQRFWDLNEKMILSGAKRAHEPRRFHVKPAFIYLVDTKGARSFAYQGGRREYDELLHRLLINGSRLSFEELELLKKALGETKLLKMLEESLIVYPGDVEVPYIGKTHELGRMHQEDYPIYGERNVERFLIANEENKKLLGEPVVRGKLPESSASSNRSSARPRLATSAPELSSSAN